MTSGDLKEVMRGNPQMYSTPLKPDDDASLSRFRYENHGAGNPLSGKDADKVWEIIDKSFPEDEKPPKERFIDDLSDPDCHFLIHRDEETGEVDCFLLYIDLPDHFVLFELLATDEGRRDKKVGGKMVDVFLKSLKPGEVTFGEIEVSGRSPMAARRANFYFRHGLLKNEGDHLQPTENGLAPVPMWMLSYPRLLTDIELKEATDLLFNKLYQGHNPSEYSNPARMCRSI